MSKRFYLHNDRIKPVATGRGHCLASNMIAVDGEMVGYMYREEPHDETDSGWVFLAGVEWQEYIDDPANFAVYDVNTIANFDPDIIPFLDAPFGSAFGRNRDSGELEEKEFKPLEISPDSPESGNVPEQGVTRAFCDECSGLIEPGQAAIRSKTDTGPAVHQSVTMALCPKCAEKYDGTGDRLLLGMAAFMAIAVVLGLASWFFSWLAH